MYVQYSLSLLLALFGVMVIFSQLNVVECAIYVTYMCNTLYILRRYREKIVCNKSITMGWLRLVGSLKS